MTVATPVRVRRPQRVRICGFCSTGNHEKCAVGTRMGFNGNMIHLCLCTQGGCEEGRRKCTTCGNRVTTEVNPETWECFDLEACRSLVEARREANPLLVAVRKAQENAAMAKIEKNAEKAEKVAKTKEPTYCLVTGEQTKGGLFKPGMDARYVSDHVAAVQAKNQTKAQALKKMKDDGVSERLVAKFEKSLGLAQEKAEKVKAAAAEKAAAKKEKASA